jgi:aspartyl-tRNA(Asn)/glutamyl-tRNA(Gln) amidotransferase subunit B
LSDYKVSDDDARLLTSDKKLSDYFDNLVSLTNDPKKSCSFITTILLALIKESEDIDNITKLRFDISELAEVIKLVNDDLLSSTNSKLVIDELFLNG